jgi:hypothetical protein
MDRFFKPIKRKVQVIELLMNSIKYMLMNPTIKVGNSQGKIILRVDKMSRLFFIKADKYYSIMFPFIVKKEGAYSFSFKNEMNIDQKITSEVMSLIRDGVFDSNCSLEFADKISTYQDINYNEFYWDFIKELIMMEDGYLRYDYDNYIKHKKSDIHPLHHYDLFYTSNATFKVGLKGKVTENDFVDLLDVKTICKFIN